APLYVTIRDPSRIPRGAAPDLLRPLWRAALAEAAMACACSHSSRDLRVTAHILEHLGLTSNAVPIAPARAPPQDPVSELAFDT
ncbi:MAG: hypothetical protein H0T46_23705, partial [Deltaproteobacteria bacterium]|nr:hypothetical protein [Deltaproteobacteria bacterium]